MLSDPTVRISDIAESTGFSDSTYFSHLFQKETGYAPRDWRKKAGEVKF
jgi:YesN/AraC family two-component response regulator